MISSLEYDAVYGRLAKRIDHEGNYITYNYDAQGNMTEKSYYGPTDNRTNWKRSLYQDPAHTMPGKLFKTINPDDTFTQYEYDSEGNIASVTDPNTHTTYYDYDALNRLTTVSQPGSAVTSYDYDAHGNLSSVMDAESHITTYEYDDMGRVLSTISPDTGTAAYAYDAAGNLTHKTDAKGISVGYAYDLLNRLTHVGFPDSSQDIGYTYDANGNITGIESKVLTYNQNNRLIRVEDNSNILGEYAYNGMGQRAIKTADGVTTVFHYDFNGNIVAESDENGNFVYEYLYKGSSRLALVDVGSGEIFSFLNDRLGTPQMLANSTNTIVWEGIYEPFGEADVNPNSSVVNNFRFAGQYYDEETGFHYNYHRYYDPQTGRYLMPDPIGLDGGINLFIYSENNPINDIDYLGLLTKGYGFNINIAVLGATANLNVQLVRDDKGDTGIAITYGGGGMGEPLGASAQYTWGETTASSILDLSGSSAVVGSSIQIPPLSPAGFALSHEGIYADSYVGLYKSVGGSAGVVPIDIYGIVTKTHVFNINDYIEKLLHDILGIPLPEDNQYKFSSGLSECE